MSRTQEIRDLLDRTGPLFTQEPDDVGHISDFWRRRIREMCALVESAPLDIADRLRAEVASHAETGAELEARHRDVAALEQRLASKAEEVERALERSRAAVRLVEDAVPRMETLNNAMSPDWLLRAAAFLEV